MCSQCLVVLGVQISMNAKGFQCKPDDVKRLRWRQSIIDILERGRLFPGEASKLAGRLSWACSVLFKCLGRAMLRCALQICLLAHYVKIHDRTRPIFDQVSKRNGKLCPELEAALRWWAEMLDEEVAERHLWAEEHVEVVHMFCDAASSPAHLGVVLFMETGVLWTHADPPEDVLRWFARRSDNQIMGLELLAISLGLSTFGQLLVGKQLVVHCDNKGAEVSDLFSLSLWRICAYARSRYEEARLELGIMRNWCISTGSTPRC